MQVLTGIVELLTGKSIPDKLKSMSTDKGRAAEQLVQHYQAVLLFLQRHGALINCVQPEHLLDSASVDLLMNMRLSRATDTAHEIQTWCDFLSFLW
jgi:hypothetical protein